MSATRRSASKDPVGDLRADLKQDSRPYYLLTGENAWLRGEALSLLRERLVPEANREFGFEERRLDSHSDWADVEAMLRSYSFFDGSKLIHLEIPGKLTAETRDALSAYLEESPGQNILCISAPSLDQLRAAKNRLVKAGGLALVFAAMDEKTLTAWATRRFKELGIEHETGIPARLVAALPGDTGEVASEIEKLRLVAPAGKKLRATDLDRLVGRQRVEDVWKLAGLLRPGSEREAMAILREILDGGGTPLELMGGLSYTFTMLLRARLLLDEGLPPARAVAELPLWAGRARDYVERARRMKKRELLAWLFNLQKLDARLKRGPAGRERHLVETTLLASLRGQALRF
jgi:DNA polymerase III subunit delta